MTKSQQERIDRLAPVVGGKRVPRYFRIYDNQHKPDSTIDNYTAVFTGHYQQRGLPKQGVTL